ncbi:hypothetical protein WICPIJ_004702 [Wickerhamomyces pijperi]|uniref:mitogen-activated protein kinase kinase n=1 Tax=Wickerhamomyces pijperi TaxID=599730 RepID=A0A9P8Q5E6_WICPI|nr:hypothetical protein WICPIJ_004702 [Wickerhamomyces pijperi]
MSSQKKPLTLNLNSSRNKPLPPIMPDAPRSVLASPIDFHPNVSSALRTPPLNSSDNAGFFLQQPPGISSSTPTLSLPGTNGNSSPVRSAFGNNSSLPETTTCTSLFQPKTLKRRNLKMLKLDEDQSQQPQSIPSPISNMNIKFSQNGSAINTPKSSTSYKNEEDLELLENLEKLTLTINKDFQFKQSDILTLKQLGEGNSGTVSKALHVPTNKLMAKKQIIFERNIKVQNQILRELKILTEVRHHSIIEFYGAMFIDSAANGGGADTGSTESESTASTAKDDTFTAKDQTKGSSKDDTQLANVHPTEVSGVNSNGVVILMEYMDCGSFDHILKKLGPLKEIYLSKITVNVLEGLNYLYTSHKILHRDIKPSNVLLNSRGEVKLADFGVSRELNNNSIADTFVGTSTYMSPERIQGDVYSIKGDVWSVGLMLIELATGDFPFGKQDTPNGILDLLQRIVNEEPPKLPRDKYSREMCNFVEMCLRKQTDRPTPDELLKMKRTLITKYEQDDSLHLLRHLAKKLKKPKA